MGRGPGLPPAALGLAGLSCAGAALVAAAVAADAARQGATDWAVTLLVAAATLAARAVVVLRAHRPAGRAAPLVLATAALALAWGLTTAPGVRVALGPGAALVALLLLAGGAHAAALRSSGRADPRRTGPGWVLAALLVAATTTPALAATDAGEHAVPHGHTSPAPSELDAPRGSGHAGH